MKALVLAGGKGTRLRPITHTSAKQLIPIANKPILFYGLEAIADAGIRDVGIVVAPETRREVEAAVGRGAAFGLTVTYIEQAEPLGLAHAVMVARDWLADDPFVMYLGDNIVMGGIREDVALFAGGLADANILLTKVANPSAFGIVEFGADGGIVGLIEKPANPPSDLALVGVYFFRPSIHDAIATLRPSARGELEITDAITELMRRGGLVVAHRVDGYWKDTGTPADLLDCNRAILDRLPADVLPRIAGTVDDSSVIVGPVHIGEGATITRSNIRGPAVIGPGVHIDYSSIGPSTSIGPDCHIDTAFIRDSIVLAGSHIARINLTHSLIGREVHIGPSAEPSFEHCVVLGDHSHVQIGPEVPW